MKKVRKIDYYAAKAVRPEDDPWICAIDVETQGFNGKLLMVQWGASVDDIKYSTADNMVEIMFNEVLAMPKPCIWYSHFAQYDWRYFIEYLLETGFEIDIGMRTDTDIYEIRIEAENGTVILRDSFALWNSPLAKLAKTFCPELPKLDIDVGKFDPTNPDHIAYAKRDVEILLVGMPRLFDMIGEHFHVVAGATTAGTALKAWQKSLEFEAIYNSSVDGPQEQFIRQGYYGGLVFLTDTNIHKGARTYDINSSYPSVMCDYGVPYGRAYTCDDYESGKMGIYRCRVRAPDNLIVPILPARNKRGAMRWYKGEFDTVVTNIELIFAAKHGYEILEIYEGICFEETVFPFNDLIDLCKMLREGFKGTATEAIAKLMQNSLYGKFGSRRERLRMMNAANMDEEDYEGATPYDEDGNWYTKCEHDSDMRCMPAWAVFITAHARLKLLSTVYAIGPANVLYGDTDSITVKAGYDLGIDSGPKYGQWKLEKEWAEFRAIAPKVYSGILLDGTRMGAAKGLPRKGLTDRNWQELLELGSSEATTITFDSLRVSMKKGITPVRQLTRKSSNLNNSSNYTALPDGTVSLKYAHER